MQKGDHRGEEVATVAF